MSSLHSFNIDKLKSDFQSILFLQNEVLTKKKVLVEKLSELKIVYNDLVKRNNKKIFLFCLDSFYFQYKCLMIEMDNLSRYISLINNRMYGDYYKLYHIILLQTTESSIKPLTAEFKKYPPYKDLEPFYEYKMSDIIKIHADILRIVQYLHSHFVDKEQKISNYQDTPHVGNSITSFIQTLEYENTLLHEQIGLYINYIGFFHVSQTQFLKKLFDRIQVFQLEIENDILSNHSSTSMKEQPALQDVSDTISTAPSLDSFFILKAQEVPSEIELLLCQTEEILDQGEEIFCKWKLDLDPDLDPNTEIEIETNTNANPQIQIQIQHLEENEKEIENTDSDIQRIDQEDTE